MNGSTDEISGRFGSSPSGRRSTVVSVVAAVVLLVGLVGGSAFGAPTAAPNAQDASSDAFLVELESDGDATVTLRMTFDLGEEGDERAFERLEGDVANRSNQFRDDLARIAERTERETGREMTVTEPSANVRVEGDVGVVELWVRWNGLAATDGDQLTVSEPFANQYQPDRQFVIEAPEGYTVERTAVSPSASDDGAVSWAAGSDLSGLTVTVERAGPADSTPTGLPAFVGLLLVWAVVYRLLNTPRRRRLTNDG